MATTLDSPHLTQSITPAELLDRARSIHPWIVSVRRELHRHPELMFDLVHTSGIVRRELDALNIQYEHPVAETGVVATIGAGNGPCVALRADMDALPIREEADVEFRSEIDGVMHACGHDCHTAMLLGAARLLKDIEPSLRGTVKLLFQPAEEGGGGGKRMCDEGALDNPRVEKIFGIHVWPMLPTGTVASRAGTLLAATSMLDIAVVGRGGHAAMPHTTIDPVSTAAKIVTELQTIVSRELDPLEPGVVSVTTIHGGEAFNVIPQDVRLTGTLRSLTMDGLRFLKQRVREIATDIARAHRCEARVEFPGLDYPPTVNDAALWSTVRAQATAIVGSDAVFDIPPVMGGEDFAYYTERIPGCFVVLGVGNESLGATFGVHHPRFKADENALPIGSAMHARFAIDAL